MKLWLISQTANRDYDTFDSAIVAANTEEEAKSIHPDNTHRLPAPENLDDAYEYRSWVREPKDVTAKIIGTAVPGTKMGVVLASFNAG